MTLYAALIYTAEIDMSDDDASTRAMNAGYFDFMKANEAVLRGGEALYPTATATTVRVAGGRGGDIVTTDGPYAETKEALTGFYLFEAADLDAAVKVAAQIPGAWNGAVEVRPVVSFAPRDGA